uniref:C-type lectin domain-containing protein n=1 Tax=Syphacia muris TaxID=451379 RepID=A0A0N5AX21_9BILA
MPNKALVGYAVVSPGKTENAVKCLQMCQNSKKSFDFICKSQSVEAFRDSRECVLNNGNSKENGDFLFSTKDSEDQVDYYENICLSEFNNVHDLSDDSKTEMLDIDNVDTKCFRSFRHRSLVGFADKVFLNVTHKQCMYQCFQCKKCLDGEPCNSLVFYRERQECILISETRRNHLDLFVEDPETDYSENLCSLGIENVLCAETVTLTFVIVASNSTNEFQLALNNTVKIVNDTERYTDTLVVSVVQISNLPVMELESYVVDSTDSFKNRIKSIPWRKNGLETDKNLETVIESEIIKDSLIIVFVGSAEQNTSFDKFTAKRKQLNTTVIVATLSNDTPSTALSTMASDQRFVVKSTNASEEIDKLIRLQFCQQQLNSFQQQTAKSGGVTIQNIPVILKNISHGAEGYQKNGTQQYSIVKEEKLLREKKLKDIWIGLYRSNTSSWRWTDGTEVDGWLQDKHLYNITTTGDGKNCVYFNDSVGIF